MTDPLGLGSHCQRELLPRLDLIGRTEIRSGALL
jgi:hypothetical protein